MDLELMESRVLVRAATRAYDLCGRGKPGPCKAGETKVQQEIAMTQRGRLPAGWTVNDWNAYKKEAGKHADLLDADDVEQAPAWRIKEKAQRRNALFRKAGMLVAAPFVAGAAAGVATTTSAKLKSARLNKMGMSTLLKAAKAATGNPQVHSHLMTAMKAMKSTGGGKGAAAGILMKAGMKVRKAAMSARSATEVGALSLQGKKLIAIGRLMRITAAAKGKASGPRNLELPSTLGYGRQFDLCGKGKPGPCKAGETKVQQEIAKGRLPKGWTPADYGAYKQEAGKHADLLDPDEVDAGAQRGKPKRSKFKRALKAGVAAGGLAVAGRSIIKGKRSAKLHELASGNLLEALRRADLLASTAKLKPTSRLAKIGKAIGRGIDAMEVSMPGVKPTGRWLSDAAAQSKRAGDAIGRVLDPKAADRLRTASKILAGNAVGKGHAKNLRVSSGAMADAAKALRELATQHKDKTLLRHAKRAAAIAKLMRRHS